MCRPDADRPLPLTHPAGHQSHGHSQGRCGSQWYLSACSQGYALVPVSVPGGGRGWPSPGAAAQADGQFLLVVQLSIAAHLLLLSRTLGSAPGGSVTWAPSSGISSCLPLPGFHRDWHPSFVGWRGSRKLLLVSSGGRWGTGGITGTCASQHPGSERASSFPSLPALSFNSPSPGDTCALRPPPD